jgi:hypothetical protein
MPSTKERCSFSKQVTFSITPLYRLGPGSPLERSPAQTVAGAVGDCCAGGVYIQKHRLPPPLASGTSSWGVSHPSPSGYSSRYTTVT